MWGSGKQPPGFFPPFGFGAPGGGPGGRGPPFGLPWFGPGPRGIPGGTGGPKGVVHPVRGGRGGKFPLVGRPPLFFRHFGPTPGDCFSTPQTPAPQTFWSHHPRQKFPAGRGTFGYRGDELRRYWVPVPLGAALFLCHLAARGPGTAHMIRVGGPVVAPPVAPSGVAKPPPRPGFFFPWAPFPPWGLGGGKGVAKGNSNRGGGAQT